MQAIPRLDIALVHYPVVNRCGDIIGSALTNLDLHDIARAASTYGVRKYWVITPFREQQTLAEEILAHWRQGHGAEANPDRKQALALVDVCATLEAAIELSATDFDQRPTIIATCARNSSSMIAYSTLRTRLWRGEPIFLVFGTGWGLAPEVLTCADAILSPIQGPSSFNHLSVRSAASVVLDRLLGRIEYETEAANS